MMSDTKILLALALTFAFSFPYTAHAKSACGPEVKTEVANALSEIANAPKKEKLAIQADLYEKYSYCAEGSSEDLVDDRFKVAAAQCGAKVSILGNLDFEEMSCCGYDPQRRQFGCPVKIKQSFGFGSAPLPGNREYVLNCVANEEGRFVPVGNDSVHLADEMHGEKPSWQFAVNANANNNLDTIYPMDGSTRNARSILSWGFEPTSCDFKPIWGNALDYRIRLDQ